MAHLGAPGKHAPSDHASHLSDSCGDESANNLSACKAGLQHSFFRVAKPHNKGSNTASLDRGVAMLGIDLIVILILLDRLLRR